eukprot:scaffold60212_cov21-Tisochrysis_lutea.AAC.2
MESMQSFGTGHRLNAEETVNWQALSCLQGIVLPTLTIWGNCRPLKLSTSTGWTLNAEKIHGEATPILPAGHCLACLLPGRPCSPVAEGCLPIPCCLGNHKAVAVPRGAQRCGNTTVHGFVDACLFLTSWVITRQWAFPERHREDGIMKVKHLRLGICMQNTVAALMCYDADLLQ